MGGEGEVGGRGVAREWLVCGQESTVPDQLAESKEGMDQQQHRQEPINASQLTPLQKVHQAPFVFIKPSLCSPNSPHHSGLEHQGVSTGG